MTIHKRAFSIHIDNPYTGTPSCTFQQERVVEVEGEIIKEPIGELKVDFDPTDERAVQLYTLLKDYYIELITLPVVVEEPVDEIPPPVVVEEPVDEIPPPVVEETVEEITPPVVEETVEEITPPVVEEAVEEITPPEEETV